MKISFGLLVTFIICASGARADVPAAPAPKKALIPGGLASGVIDTYIKRHWPELGACYTRQLQLAAKPFQGVIKTYFVIDPQGKVSRAEKASSTLNNEKVENCVLKVVKSIVFPKPQGGAVVDVDYPFSFSPATKGTGP